MPQLDLGTSLPNVKLARGAAGKGEGDRPYYVPGSFWLSGDALSTRYAFFERKYSINSHAAILPPLYPGSNSSSQHFSVNLKSMPSIIGLPKTQETTFKEAKNRKNVKPSGKPRLFPNRAGSTASKLDHAAVEPGSPKVSCMGRVRSKRDRNLLMRKAEPVTANKGMPVHEPSERSGLLLSLRAMFRARRRRRRSGRKDGPPSGEESWRIVRDIRERLPAADALRSESDGDLPSLGGTKRLVSWRRSDSRAGNVA